MSIFPQWQWSANPPDTAPTLLQLSLHACYLPYPSQPPIKPHLPDHQSASLAQCPQLLESHWDQKDPSHKWIIIAARAAGRHASRVMFISGGYSRILKHHFKTPNIHLLKNAAWWIRDILKLGTAPLCEVVVFTLAKNNEWFKDGKSWIC